ncbi:transmembrane protein 41A-B [Galendromus occidentalis]|uniref:Transmembrane protein 41A-B n=1 Tax=Galendromus occidentalis TaxID=34638 RepID=A0AAJ6VZ11_9ACAR|nr:transmembrane protein 41A-B [Galendromus occidentalis]
MSPILRLLGVPIFLSAATAWLYFLSKNAPDLRDSAANSTISLKFPSSFEELHGIAALLQHYYASNANYVYLLFCSAYLYKQTFAIPGSVFLNLLAGALFGVFPGFLLACFLTACGATCCYLLSRMCGRHVIRTYIKFLASKLTILEKKVDDNRDDLIYFLLFLRLFPITPNWFLNMASPLVGIPIHLFFFSVFVGLMPYNFISVQSGALLSEIRSTSDILTPKVALQMGLLAVAALIPAVLKQVQSKKRELKERMQ